MSDLLSNPKELEAAMNRAVREATLMHARLGNPVATWRDGRVIWLRPDEVFDLLSINAAEAGSRAR